MVVVDPFPRALASGQLLDDAQQHHFPVAKMFLSQIIARRAAAFLLGFATVPSLVQAYPDPITCSGNCWAHDPSIVKRSDGTYFRFNTGSEIGISTASALTGPWTYLGSALPSGSSIDLTGNTDLWVCSHLSPSLLCSADVVRNIHRLYAIIRLHMFNLLIARTIFTMPLVLSARSPQPSDMLLPRRWITAPGRTTARRGLRVPRRSRITRLIHRSSRQRMGATT